MFLGAALLIVGAKIFTDCGSAVPFLIGAGERGQTDWTTVAETIGGAIVGTVLCGLGLMLIARGKKPNLQ
jgi:hypothetical protein